MQTELTSDLPLESPFFYVDDFYPGAELMRRAFEAHFESPHNQNEKHRIWNYWYEPEIYTYLRADPGDLFESDLISDFLIHLNAWAGSRFGLVSPAMPWISLYVNGCRQGFHNDSENGQMAFVFSLTRWTQRRFLGGETLIIKPDDYWGTQRMTQAGAGPAFIEKIPSLFNRLVLFDDRIVHGVEPLQGSMDPLDGRVVIHGHFVPLPPTFRGPLKQEVFNDQIAASLDTALKMGEPFKEMLHGFATFDLTISAKGTVELIKPLVNRVVPLKSHENSLTKFLDHIHTILNAITFPSAKGPSHLLLSVMVPF